MSDDSLLIMNSLKNWQKFALLAVTAITFKFIKEYNSPKPKPDIFEQLKRYSESSKRDTSNPIYSFPNDCYTNLSEYENCSDLKLVVSHPCGWKEYPKGTDEVKAMYAKDFNDSVSILFTVSVFTYLKDSSEFKMNQLISEKSIRNRLSKREMEYIGFNKIEIENLKGTEMISFYEDKKAGCCYMCTNSIIYRNHLVVVTYLAGAPNKKIASKLFYENEAMFREQVRKIHSI